MNTIKISAINNKNSKNIIKLILPSSNTFLLKADSSVDFFAWYSHIHSSINNAKAKGRINKYDRSISNLENNNSEIDKMNLLSFFNGVTGMLKIKEAREVLFERLEFQKPEYKYLGILYNSIIKYKEFYQYEQFAYAMMKFKNICKIMTNFTISDYEEEVKADNHDKPIRQEIMEDIERVYIEEDVRKLMKDIFPSSIKLTLNKLVKQNDPENLTKSLFDKIEENLITKFNEIYQEIDSFDDESVQMLKIPLKTFKKSFHYAPKLQFLGNLIESQKTLINFPTRNSFYSTISPFEEECSLKRGVSTPTYVSKSSFKLVSTFV